MSVKPKGTLITIDGEHYKIGVNNLVFVWWVDYWKNSTKDLDFISKMLVKRNRDDALNKATNKRDYYSSVS